MGFLLTQLPDRCREVFLLSRIEGKKYTEIAQIMGISAKTVENQMGKALRVLREQLSPYLISIWVILSLGSFIQSGVGVFHAWIVLLMESYA